MDVYFHWTGFPNNDNSNRERSLTHGPNLTDCHTASARNGARSTVSMRIPLDAACSKSEVLSTL